MKRYDVEIIHEPSGQYLNYSVYSEEEYPDIYNNFINEISVIIIDQEEVEDSYVDTDAVI